MHWRWLPKIQASPEEARFTITLKRYCTVAYHWFQVQQLCHGSEYSPALLESLRYFNNYYDSRLQLINYDKFGVKNEFHCHTNMLCIGSLFQAQLPSTAL